MLRIWALITTKKITYLEASLHKLVLFIVSVSVLVQPSSFAEGAQLPMPFSKEGTQSDSF